MSAQPNRRRHRGRHHPPRPGRAHTLVERITEFDGPRALAYDVEGFPRWLGRVNNRWTLAPSAGATVVTLTSTLEIGSRPPQRLAERIVAHVSAKQLDALLAGLTYRLEGTRA